MIRDAEALIASAQSGLGHRLERVHPIRAVGVGVEDSGDIRVGHKIRQRSGKGASNFIAALAQLAGGATKVVEPWSRSPE